MQKFDRDCGFGQNGSESDFQKESNAVNLEIVDKLIRQLEQLESAIEQLNKRESDIREQAQTSWGGRAKYQNFDPKKKTNCPVFDDFESLSNLS